MSKSAGALWDRWILNKETISVNDSIFSRGTVQEYVTHSEKKPYKHKKIGKFSLYVLCVTANVI